MEKCCVGQIVENSVNTAIILSLPFLLSGRSSPWPTLSYEGWKRAGKGTQRDKGLACRPLLLHGDVRVLNGRKGNYAQKLQKLQPFVPGTLQDFLQGGRTSLPSESESHRYRRDLPLKTGGSRTTCSHECRAVFGKV